MFFRRIVDARDDTLAEYCGDVVGGVGFVVFVIDMPGNIGVFGLAQFHVKYLTMYVREICLVYIKLERLQQSR